MLVSKKKCVVRSTHWWNIQEQSFEYQSSLPSEINHDVLYREGLTNKQEVTFTPRLLLVDLKGSLKTLPESGGLYDPSHKAQDYSDGDLEVQEASSSPKNRFLRDLDKLENPHEIYKRNYNLDSEVNVWSDFLYARFHPRTVNILNNYEHCNDQTPFDAFPLGINIWNTPQFTEDFTDKIRNYVEECDNFQGIHMLTDCTNAFAGLSSSCLEYLKDEYVKKSVLVFPVIPPYFPDNDYNSDTEEVQSIMNDSVRVVNLAVSFNSFALHSSMFVPLSVGSQGWRQPGSKIDFPYIHYNQKLPYHSSGILATALDTLTLKHRLRNTHFTLDDLCADLTFHGRKAVAASLSLPFPIEAGGNLLDCLDKWEGPLFKSITPRCTIGTSHVMQHITLRGLIEEKLKKARDVAGKQMELPAYRCNSITEMLNLYLGFVSDATLSNVTTVYKPLSVRNPFPKIFDSSLGPDGYIHTQLRTENINVETLPVLAGLHNEANVGKMLQSLYDEARKIKIARFQQFNHNGMERDELEESLNSLLTFRENYQDND